MVPQTVWKGRDIIMSRSSMNNFMYQNNDRSLGWPRLLFQHGSAAASLWPPVIRRA
jgi:hypothetical protein